MAKCKTATMAEVVELFPTPWKAKTLDVEAGDIHDANDAYIGRCEMRLVDMYDLRTFANRFAAKAVCDAVNAAHSPKKRKAKP